MGIRFYETITGCLNSATGVITFPEGTCDVTEIPVPYSACLVDSGVHKGQIKLTTLGSDSRPADTFYGCLDSAGHFEIVVPLACCCWFCSQFPIDAKMFVGGGEESEYGGTYRLEYFVDPAYPGVCSWTKDCPDGFTAEFTIGNDNCCGWFAAIPGYSWRLATGGCNNEAYMEMACEELAAGLPVSGAIVTFPFSGTETVLCPAPGIMTAPTITDAYCTYDEENSIMYHHITATGFNIPDSPKAGSMFMCHTNSAKNSCKFDPDELVGTVACPPTGSYIVTVTNNGGGSFTYKVHMKYGSSWNTEYWKVCNICATEQVCSDLVEVGEPI